MGVDRPAEPSFTELDYIANLLYQNDIRKQGYIAGCRWWCHGEKGRKKWRKEANAAFREWANSERAELRKRV